VTSIGCISLTSCRASLRLLERTSYSSARLVDRLPALRIASGADQLGVLSTCERTELYAVWSGEADPDGLVRALASDQGLPVGEVAAAVGRFIGVDAVRHLFRVTTGLESFVIGEKDIVGQVRAAAELSHLVEVGGFELDRLMAAAVSTSRHAHRQTTFAEAGRSVGTAAVDAVTEMRGGTLAGCRLLVVGAGEMATAVVGKACLLGATVTVCNRTRRRAARFLSAGAAVVDLAELGRCLATADVAIVGTAAPHPLIGRTMVETARSANRHELLLVDLCLPRNVDESVRGMPAVQLVDLADLRATGSGDVGALAEDAAAAERVVDEEVTRFSTWLAGRPAAEAVRRLRADSEAVARQELERLRQELPEELHDLVERGLVRAVRRLVHGPTRELLTAAESGDVLLVERLAAMFAPSERRI
jgi:glutamyl-tRNA reductase